MNAADEADDRTDDIPPQMSAVVALNGTGATFHPFLTGPRIALEASFVAKDNFAGGIGQKIQQSVGEVLALDLPGF